MKGMEVLVYKDQSDDYKIPADPWTLPMRLAICGRSDLSGKTNMVMNLLMRDQLYRSLYYPENIFVFCGSARSDPKYIQMIEELGIPPGNVHERLVESEVQRIVDSAKEKYEADLAAGVPPRHTMLLFDDVGYDGGLKAKKFGAVSQVACNSRHEMISCIIVIQDYTQLSTTMRKNLSGCLVSTMAFSEFELFERDNYVGAGGLTKKRFREIYYDVTGRPYSFFGISRKSSTYGNRWKMLDNLTFLDGANVDASKQSA